MVNSVNTPRRPAPLGARPAGAWAPGAPLLASARPESPHDPHRPDAAPRPAAWHLLIGLLAAALVLAVPAALSGAATIPGAITSVSVRETTTTATQAMTLDLTWTVPDETRAGDSFALTLPPELVALSGTAITLRAPDGQDVATAAVVDSTVTFTMTAYAESRVGVHGSAFFSVGLRAGVQPGPLALTFTADGVVFRDEVTVVAAPKNDYSATATKWAKWLVPGTPGVGAEDRMLWAIAGPRIASLTPMTFVDEPGPGQALQCASFDVFTGSANISGALAAPVAFVPRDQWTRVECGPSRAVIRFTPRRADVGRVPMLLGRSAVTDDSPPSYRNSGSVTIGNGTIPVQTTVLAAGGQASGTAAPAPSTTTTTTASAPPSEAVTTTTTPPVDAGTSVPPGAATTGTASVSTTEPAEDEPSHGPTDSASPPVDEGTMAGPPSRVRRG